MFLNMQWWESPLSNKHLCDLLQSWEEGPQWSSTCHIIGYQYNKYCGGGRANEVRLLTILSLSNFVHHQRTYHLVKKDG